MKKKSANRQGAPKAELAQVGGQMRAGQWHRAGLMLSDMLRRYPGDPEVCRLSGIAAHRTGENTQAITFLREALELHPDPALVHTNLGSVLRGSGDAAGALEAFEEALKLSPKSEPALYNLGLLHQQYARPKAARQCFERALKLQPKRVESWLGLGHACKNLGDIEASAMAYRRGLKLNPTADFWWALANIKTVKFEDHEVAQMSDLSTRSSTQPGLYFALAKALEDRGEYEAAFTQLQKGNRLQRKRVQYDAVAKEALGNRIKASFDLELAQRHKASGHSSNAPIFIIGMPRSGSTLVEQILSSHPEVTGASELPDLGQVALTRLGDDALGGWSPERIKEVSAEELWQMGAEYLKRTERWQETSRFTDKLPHNFPLVGLIGLILPNASIIDCRRDPRDTGLSCYRQLFHVGQHWSYNLEEIAAYYRYYRGLMNHWHDVMPGRVLEVRYERLLDDFESEVKRIVAFCQLKWDERCLDFTANNRAVRTASAAQVRGGLTRESVERWRAYEPWLGPVLALGEKY